MDIAVVSTPIMILASERSGTNLLRSLMSNHPNIEGPVAPHFMDAFWPVLTCYGDLRERSRMERLLSDMIQLANHPYHDWQLGTAPEELLEEYAPSCFMEAFHAVYSAKARMSGKSRFVCKDNHLFDYAFAIKSRYPDARFVYLVRDPRDHVASWMKRPFHLRTPYDAAIKWKREQALCRALLESHDLDAIRIRYEDLIADPEQVMTSVLEAVGESPDPACFDTDRRKNQDLAWNAYWRNLSKPILKNNTKKYRSQLRPAAVELVESVCEEEMIWCAYEFDTPRRWRPPLLHGPWLRMSRLLVGMRNRKHIIKDMEQLTGKQALLRRLQEAIRDEERNRVSPRGAL